MTTTTQQPDVHRPSEGETQPAQTEFIPDADIYEFEDHYLLAVDLPGVDEAHAGVELKENVLEITGDPVVEDPGNHQLLQQGCYAGRYRRVFELGNKIEREGISAHLKNGTMRVVLPKARALQPRKITVEPAG